MKKFVALLLFLPAAAGEANTSRVSVAKRRFELLCRIATKMADMPKFKRAMVWQNGGVINDAFIDHLRQHHHRVYDSYSELGLRIKLGVALARELEIFALQVKMNGRTVNKYFWGEEPDIPALVSEIISSSEIKDKLEWEHGGLSMDEILTELKEFYPDVYTLYVQASEHKNDYGLRTALGAALERETGGRIFALQVEVGGKAVSKYFWGERPDMPALVAEVISSPELSNKFEWEHGGLSMDEILTKIKELRPDVYTLYVRASDNGTEHGLRILLGQILERELEDEVFSLRIKVGGKTTRNYFWGEEPDISALVDKLIYIPEFRSKMQPQNGGLSMDEIVDRVGKLYSDVYTLYVQASDNGTDYGFRTVLGAVMEKKLGDRAFSLQVNTNGKIVQNYFWGEKPDLPALVAEVISSPKLSNKFEWEHGGLSMDEIVAKIKELHPYVYTLYVRDSDHGLRTTLGMTLGRMSEIASRKDSEDNARYFWQNTLPQTERN